jgi:hypothetical protein
MAKNDQGYTKSTGSSWSGGSSRGRSRNTIIKEAKKDEIIDAYIRAEQSGILDVLGLHPSDPDYQDIAAVIRENVEQEIADDKMTKETIYSSFSQSRRDSGEERFQAITAKQEIERQQSASILLDALYAATKTKERFDLDEGDMIDDPVSLMIDGSGWGQETTGRLEMHKHVSIAIDNSGSTHTSETGFCSSAMQQVTNSLLRVLYTAASEYPGVTYDGFSFNKIAECHTGQLGRDRRAALVRDQFKGVVVDDPHMVNAVQTNLSPLIRLMYENEEMKGLIGQPRLDIILTDGEFESDEDAQEAAEWQRKRGPGVTTYVLNLCPDEMEDRVALPYQFRVIPVHCIEDGAYYKSVDSTVLKQVLNRIVVAEVSDTQN